MMSAEDIRVGNKHSIKTTHRRRAARRLFTFISLLMFIAACDDRHEETLSADPDTQLMKDLGQASPELEHRLLNSVSVQDGLNIVRATSLDDTYVLPTRLSSNTANVGSLTPRQPGNATRWQAIRDAVCRPADPSRSQLWWLAG
jgi:hypothetical protein